MTIIEQIKAEIERRIDAHHAHGHFCAEHEFRDVLSFISTLESEKPIGGLENEAVSYCFDNGLNLSPRVATDFARHFAQWGAEHLKEIEL